MSVLLGMNITGVDTVKWYASNDVVVCTMHLYRDAMV